MVTSINNNHYKKKNNEHLETKHCPRGKLQYNYVFNIY